MTRARWIIVAVTAAVLAAGVIAALAYSPDDATVPTSDLYRQYTATAWPCGEQVPQWDTRPADPHNALGGSWPLDDTIAATLAGSAVSGPAEWTSQRLEGLKLWVAAVRGAHYWVLDTYGPILAERALQPAEENERSTTLRDANARFERALLLTSQELRTGKSANWGDMERPTKRLCEGIYRGR